MESLKIYRPDVTVFLLFSTTLKKRTIISQIETLDLQLKQFEEDLKNIETYLLSSMVNFLIQIVEMEKVLELNQEQFKSAQEKTKKEQLRRPFKLPISSWYAYPSRWLNRAIFRVKLKKPWNYGNWTLDKFLSYPRYFM